MRVGHIHITVDSIDKSILVASLLELYLNYGRAYDYECWNKTLKELEEYARASYV